ncbi:methyltransferase [Dechloromonas denitrificans]|uniref:methyltransferase n=1 Tax=Dechloromonas denitrificans TaxID=281362 RepID=UPI001CF85ABF|nr:methyltransferase [Dechloromonas denitrificans]UCV02407.1 methyltransferase [Dechloromonas denitrificans]
MRLLDRQRQLDALLLNFHALWHPQPFREIRPAWCRQWPALTAELLALSDEAVVHLNDDGAAALTLLARHLPEVAALAALVDVPARPGAALTDYGPHWAREIPGRKLQQIEAFAAAARCCGRPVLDWCGGKGHLGRLLAQQWQMPVQTLEIDPVLCSDGDALARRGGFAHEFVVADALITANVPVAGQHAVALHACGDLHRRLITQGAKAQVARFDIAPCCYYRGVAERYQPLSSGLRLVLQRDDTRLAVTESVTAAPRETRQRDRAIAWKLGFDSYRRTVSGDTYKSFKPVPESWVRGRFADFLARMNCREGLPALAAGKVAAFEAAGWQRQREVMRLSIVRHAFRRALEIWLGLDLGVFLEERGYAVDIGSFCERRLTPRNLLISARLG